MHSTSRSARAIMWHLLYGIWTYGVKVIEFQSFYELKNWKIHFIFILATIQGTPVYMMPLTNTFYVLKISKKPFIVYLC